MHYFNLGYFEQGIGQDETAREILSYETQIREN